MMQEREEGGGEWSERRVSVQCQFHRRSRVNIVIFKF